MYIKLPRYIIYPHNSNKTRNPPKSPCRSPIGLVQFVQSYKFRIRKSRLNRPAEMGDRSILVSQQQQQVEIEFGGRKGSTSSKKKMKSSNKRRFSEEQVRWLETMFQNEAKLEPRQKAEVASQLGLHPRQVAIWFQNKRARWKSRQLQQDFDALRRDYDALASRFDLLKRDNHSLSLQLQKLKDLVGKPQEHNKVDAVVNDQESESNNEKKPGLSIDEECQYTNYFGMEESTANLLPMVEPTCSSLTSDEEWHGLQSDGLFDQSPSSCEWWDFWS